MDAAAAWMVAGYLVAAIIMHEASAGALASVPGNLVQGGISIVAATALAAAVRGVNQRYRTHAGRL